MTLPPVWLLDIDGVINAVSRKPDRGVWPADQWITGEANADGVDWPILAARPVVDFIRETHESGRAEIRWHTTWQRDAANLAKLLGLPEFPVQPCPEFAAERQLLAGAAPVGPTWWKLPAAERVVGDEGRALVWTDDDARWELRDQDRDALSRLAPTLIVAPRTHLGLTRKQLRKIDAFLTEQGGA
ncbi:hypothetical protein AB0J86_15255 [Micromonospora sp. NPDC049559]|uniref:hypothetical protein n=1 Tax=Micromonospora sp. NPDC049559 TaxID=3155923 RepID=UPI0034465B7A